MISPTWLDVERTRNPLSVLPQVPAHHEKATLLRIPRSRRYRECEIYIAAMMARSAGSGSRNIKIEVSPPRLSSLRALGRLI